MLIMFVILPHYGANKMIIVSAKIKEIKLQHHKAQTFDIDMLE